MKLGRNDEAGWHDTCILYVFIYRNISVFEPGNILVSVINYAPASESHSHSSWRDLWQPADWRTGRIRGCPWKTSCCCFCCCSRHSYYHSSTCIMLVKAIWEGRQGTSQCYSCLNSHLLRQMLWRKPTAPDNRWMLWKKAKSYQQEILKTLPS